ncbi:MAG: protein O-mannosyl-transferase family [Anaerolineae bacterium]
MAIALPLYLAFRSVSLDDFDSYSFALALNEFDLTLQQPQPPGFPVYIALGHLLFALKSDAVWALTTLSAVSGTLSVLLVYLIGQIVDPQSPRSAVLSALLFALVPVTWLTSEKALSDMLGLLAILLALWLWLVWRSRRAAVPGQRSPVAAALVTGIALGVRPQNALPLILIIGALLAQDLTRARPWRPWVIAAGLCAVGILLWLIPTARATGGLLAYLAHIRDHAIHVGRADSLIGTALPIGHALRLRLTMFGETLLTSLVGVRPYPRPLASESLRLTVLAAVTLLGLSHLDWRNLRTKGLLLWFVSVTAQILLFETLDRPRLLLPTIPPLVLLVGSGLARIERPRWALPALTAGVSLALLLQSTPWAATLSQVPSPPTQATAYIEETYSPEETLIAAAGSFRAAQVDLPAYPLLYLYRFDAQALTDGLSTGRHYIAILDRDQFTPEAIETLTSSDTWVTVEDRTFTRDWRSHTQHDQVRLQVLAPSTLVPADALRLPANGCIDLGSDQDGRYLGQGWFRPETIGGAQGRWAGGTLTSALRLRLDTDTDYELTLRALAYPASQSVTLRLEGNDIETLPVPDSWEEIQTFLPAEQLPVDAPATLELVHAHLESPQARGDGSDARSLSAAYDWVCLIPVTNNHN